MNRCVGIIGFKNIKNRFKNTSEGKSIENDSISRWFNTEYLQQNPDVYDFFLKILQKKKNIDFLPAYKIFVEADDYFLDFSKLIMPTLIITGENEVGSTPKMSKMLNQKIKNSKLYIVPKAKHMATFETANLVNIEISKFYSTPKSNGFINGVLDKVFEDLKKDGRIIKVGRGLIQ